MTEGGFFHLISAVSNIAVVSGANLLVQSSIIIGFGFLVISMFKKKGAAFQSLVLKACLIAVVLAIPSSFTLNMTGIKRLTFNIPTVNTGGEKSDRSNMVMAEKKSVRKNTAVINNEDYLTAKPAPGKETKKESLNNDSLVNQTLINRSITVNTAVSKKSSKPERLEQKSKVTQKESGYPADRNARAYIYIMLTSVWILFSSFLLLRLICMLTTVSIWCRKGIPANPEYNNLCLLIADDIEIKPPLLKHNPFVKSPLLTGILRPCILFPLGEKEKLYDVKSAFLHELFHLKRKDHIWNIFSHFVSALISFQPLLRILSRRLEETADYVCDDFVINYESNSKIYAMSLLNVSLGTDVMGHERDVSVGMSSYKSTIGRRIERLFDDNLLRPLKNSFRLITVVAASFFCSVVFSGFIGFKGKKLSADVVSDKGRGKTVSFPYKETENEFISEPKEKMVSVPENSFAESEPKEENTGNSEKNYIAYNSLLQDDHETITRTIEFKNSSDANDEYPSSILSNDNIPGEKENFYPNNALIGKVSESVSEKNSGGNKDDVILNGLGFSAYTMPNLATGMIPSGYSKLIQPSEDFESLSKIDTITRTEDYKKLSNSQFDPVWSPDGQYIAFTDREYGVWVVPAAGGEPILVFDNFYSPEKETYGVHLSNLKTFSFSSDSQSILFEIWEVDETRTNIVTYNDGSKMTIRAEGLIPVLYSTDIRTGETKKVSDNSVSGKYSNDGRYFGFRRFDVITYVDNVLCEQNFVLGVNDNTTGETEYLTDKNYEIKEFAFSEDNSFIVASMRKTDEEYFHLYKINIATKEILQLTSYTKETTFSDISAGINWVRFIDYSKIPGEIVYIDTETGAEERQYLPALARKAVFSNDNNNVCYVFEIKGEEKTYNLYTSLAAAKPAFVKESEISELVMFSLKGNFPNPFNISTTIEFTLPHNGKVNLIIYNSLGQKIRRLVSDTMSPGTHQIVWDGKDDYGNTVSSGVYISSLSTGNHRLTNKMTMLK